MKDYTSQINALFKITESIAQADSADRIYEFILDIIVEELGVERASIMAFDSNINALRIVAARGLDPHVVQNAIVRIGDGISGRVFANKEPVLIQDLQVTQLDTDKQYKTKSLISAPVTCFPMTVGKESMGVINVTDKVDGSVFTEDDLNLLTVLSNQIAIYMHLSNLLEEKQEMNRLKQQLEIARQVQYRLLPTLPPEIEGLSVSGRLITAERVGGDYYDTFTSDKKRPSFVVADVSGHSIGAALIMAAFRSAIRSQRDNDFSPSELVQRVNTILYEDLYQSEQFISMCFLQYMRARQTIQYTAAGHPPPLVWRCANNCFEEFGTDDPLLGIEQHAVFHDRQMVVSQGDIIILYTDGITEALNQTGERFGLQRLKNCIHNVVDQKAHSINDYIVNAVQEFMSPLNAKDDITMLVIKIK